MTSVLHDETHDSHQIQAWGSMWMHDNMKAHVMPFLTDGGGVYSGGKQQENKEQCEAVKKRHSKTSHTPLQ